MARKLLTKEAIQSKYGLSEAQAEAIFKVYAKTKSDTMLLDQATYFKQLNEGTRSREFMFVFVDDCHKKRGVYKIYYDGPQFYIGRAKNIGIRFKHHKRIIADFFKTGNYPEAHYLSNVFEYLKSNPTAYYFRVELQEECFSVKELIEKEQQCLNRYKDSPNCLNVGFVAEPVQNEIEETTEQEAQRRANTGVYKRGGRTVFYTKDRKIIDGLPKAAPATITNEKKKMAAQSFSFNLPETESNIGSCVYKLYYGDRYIIQKGKYLSISLKLIEKGYAYFDAYNHKVATHDDYFFKFYNYIKKHPGLSFAVDIIANGGGGYELLLAEQKALNLAMKDKKNMNGNMKAYVPSFNSKTGMHGWITQEEVEMFYTYLSEGS